jgi:hypothetical protein
MSQTLEGVLHVASEGPTKVILLVHGLVVTGTVVSPAELVPHLVGQPVERGPLEPDCMCLVDATVIQGGRTIGVPALVVERASIDGGMGGFSFIDQ